MLLLGLPSFITAAIVLYERGLDRGAWLSYSESTLGKVIGSAGVVCGFLLAPLGVLMLLGQAVALSRDHGGRVRSIARRQLYGLWLCFTCSLIAFLFALDTFRRAVLGFEMHR